MVDTKATVTVDGLIETARRVLAEHGEDMDDRARWDWHRNGDHGFELVKAGTRNFAEWSIQLELGHKMEAYDHYIQPFLQHNHRVTRLALAVMTALLDAME